MAMADEAMLEKGDVEGVYEGSLFRDRHPSSRIGTRLRSKRGYALVRQRDLL